METLEEPALLAPPNLTPFELGALVGKSQAFDFMKRHCSAAEAQCLKRVRETRSYEIVRLTWEQFCRQHVNISRSYADKLIQRLDEFGEPYFQLSEIAPISPEAYRAIAPAITPQGLEIEGHVVPIIPENARRIRNAVAALRNDLDRERRLAPNPTIGNLQTRLDTCFDQMYKMTLRALDRGDEAALKGLIDYSRDKLNRVAANLAR